MIVLRIDVRGHSADVRWAGAEAVVGSGPAAAIQRDDAGWAAREAVLVHLGTEVLLVQADGRGQSRLRVGDSARLCDATLTLIGLLPLPSDPAPDFTPVPASGSAAPEAASPLEDEPAWTVVPRDDPALRIDERPAAAPSAWMPTLEEETAVARAPSTPAPSDVAPSATASSEASGRPRRWRSPTFEDELASMLKRSPWFLLSVAVHLILIVGLMFLLPGSPPADQTTSVYGVTSATQPAEDPLESGGTLDTPDPMKAPEEYQAPDLDMPAPEEPPTPLPPSPETPPRTPPESSALPPQPEPDSAPTPALIGPSHGAITARVKPRRSPPSAPPSADEVVYEGEHLAQDARRRAAARVKASVLQGGGALGKALKGLRTEDILVVRGSFDHMEAVLEELGIPFTLRSPYELATDYDFAKHKLIFWNCGDWVLPPRFRAPVLTALREFVQAGGYLFTTDWAVGTILAPTFPGYLDTSGGRKTLEELVLDVRPATNAENHRLLEGVFDGTAKAKWWLESASFDVIVRDPSKVEVLVEAPHLAERPLGRSSVIAATFTYGRGRVLHVMGHYDQQKGNLAGTVGVQRLPLNFVRMRLERDAPPPAATR